jgi:pimeloyl-ACP methyl ester carboxylesterase
VELVSDLFCCHLVNAPRCARTSPPADTSGYDLPAIIAFFDEVRLGPVTVMGHSWGGPVAAAWAAALPESVTRLVVIDGYPGGHDGGDPAVDHDAARAEQERACGRHAREPWYDAAVRAVAEEDYQGWEEKTWKTRRDPAWPMYFADPSSPMAAPHLAQFRAEVRMNLAVSRAWFGDVHHFDDINILPSPAGLRCPSLVIAEHDDFICGPAWNRPIAAAIPAGRYVEIADRSPPAIRAIR